MVVRRSFVAPTVAVATAVPRPARSKRKAVLGHGAKSAPTPSNVHRRSVGTSHRSVRCGSSSDSSEACTQMNDWRSIMFRDRRLPRSLATKGANSSQILRPLHDSNGGWCAEIRYGRRCAQSTIAAEIAPCQCCDQPVTTLANQLRDLTTQKGAPKKTYVVGHHRTSPDVPCRLRNRRCWLGGLRGGSGRRRRRASAH